MNKLFPIVLALMFNICYSNQPLRVGLEFGGGSEGLSFGFGIEESDWFLIIQSNAGFSEQDDNYTYDFSSNLFDDEEMGEVKTYGSAVIGKVFSKPNNLKLYLGGGYTNFNKYYKRYDASEILSPDGIYYIENGTESLPTVYFGFTKKLPTSNIELGASLNLLPLNLSLLAWF
tara:strand:+ start:2319 stop:2837 length:519 start_codon:yes stop_codon:yes gene_type:complete